MAEKATNNRARAGVVRAENPLFQQMGAEAATREGAAIRGRQGNSNGRDSNRSSNNGRGS